MGVRNMLSPQKRSKITSVTRAVRDAALRVLICELLAAPLAYGALDTFRDGNSRTLITIATGLLGLQAVVLTSAKPVPGRANGLAFSVAVGIAGAFSIAASLTITTIAVWISPGLPSLGRSLGELGCLTFGAGLVSNWPGVTERDTRGKVRASLGSK